MENNNIMKTIMFYTWLLLLMMFFEGNAYSQENYLWPVPGKQAGDDILYRPQDYIGVADGVTQAELNFDRLIIGAPFWTPVLCPVDGTITHANICYHNSFSCSIDVYGQQTGNFEHDSVRFVEWGMSPEKIRYMNTNVSIRIADGREVHVSGMRPLRLFKTGETVHRGDVLGTVGYYYKRIKEPCVVISISKNSQADDPMTPFDLKTTFIPPKANNKIQLTHDEAVADLDGLMEAFEDAFPRLYDYTLKDEFDAFLARKKASIGETIPVSDFEVIVHAVISKVRDSHTSIISKMKMKGVTMPTSVLLGWFNDTLQVWRAVPKYKNYLGKKVVSVNGIPADSLKTILLEFDEASDGYVKSCGDLVLIYGMDNYFCEQIAKDCNITVTFADGETKRFEQMGRKDPAREPKWIEYAYHHFHVDEKALFQYKKLSDSVAYLDLRTFELDEMQEDSVRAFFSQIIADSIPNLIIDLRDNYGGPRKVMETIYSYLAQKPFCTSLYRFVNKRGGFKCFGGSCPVDEKPMGVFAEYEPLPNGEGFVKNEQEWVEPDSVVNYKGRLYVLTNEASFSASTSFAGFVKKQNRGVIVGRETGSAYHQMKAEHFTQYMMPTSGITVQIPMIKIVADTVVSERFPYGRGVLPDYPVNFTPEELSFAHGDSILNYTQQLIRECKYIYYVEPEPETSSVEEDARPFRWWWVAIGVAVVLLVGIFGISKPKVNNG